MRAVIFIILCAGLSVAFQQSVQGRRLTQSVGLLNIAPPGTPKEQYKYCVTRNCTIIGHAGNIAEAARFFSSASSNGPGQSSYNSSGVASPLPPGLGPAPPSAQASAQASAQSGGPSSPPPPPSTPAKPSGGPPSSGSGSSGGSKPSPTPTPTPSKSSSPPAPANVPTPLGGGQINVGGINFVTDPAKWFEAVGIKVGPSTGWGCDWCRKLLATEPVGAVAAPVVPPPVVPPPAAAAAPVVPAAAAVAPGVLPACQVEPKYSAPCCPEVPIPAGGDICTIATENDLNCDRLKVWNDAVKYPPKPGDTIQVCV